MAEAEIQQMRLTQTADMLDALASTKRFDRGFV
jgi:hypothetical protein